MSASRRARLLTWVVAFATGIALLGPIEASADEYERVREQRDALESEVERVTAELDDLRAQIDQTADEIATLQKRAVELEAEADEAKAALENRARAAFMRGGESLPFASLLSAEGPQAAIERAGLVATLSRRDVAALENTGALKIRIEQTRTLLRAKNDELATYQQDLEARGSVLQDRFRLVSSQYRELRSRKERQRRISRGVQQGIYACIFDGAFHFRDTWGAPRSGGRRHRGTDVMAPYRAPVYAFTNGRVSRLSRSRLGGIGLYLRGDDGVQYYYAHLDGYAPGVRAGMRVEAGQLIGYNGYTGNASRSAPHVHFEVHPGGGGAVNPYLWLRTACYG